MTRRSAAKRFGVAASTAIKWVEQWQLTGEVSPRPQGGDRRSQHLEAHAEEILGLVEQRPDITLAEISADFNPIEMAFSKFKAFLKKLAPRTVDDLWQAIAEAVDIFTPDECENYFAAAGYDRD